MAGEFCVWGHYAEFFLFLEDFFSVGFPAIVEFAFVFVCPLLGDMMWRMHGASAEVQKEGFVRGNLLGIGNE
jgi:hypothetical protein